MTDEGDPDSVWRDEEIPLLGNSRRSGSSLGAGGKGDWASTRRRRGFFMLGKISGSFQFGPR